MDTPRLHTQTRTGAPVDLRAHSDQDVGFLVQTLTDERVAPLLSGPPQPFREEHAVSWVGSRAAQWGKDNGCEWTWMVDLDGSPAGQLSLRPRGDGAAEVGFVLAPAAQGKGVMSAALREAARWAFRAPPEDGAGLELLHWRARAGNWASRRVAWSAGFCVEGRVRGLLKHRGAALDGWIGSLRRGDPLSPAVPWLQVPQIEIGDVLLRENLGADADRILQACAHPSTQQWLPDLPAPYTLAHAHGYIESRHEQHALGDGLFWAVADASEPDLLLGQIGVMGLQHGLSRSAEIGYWMHPAARRRGVATTAVRAAARHALLPLEDGGLGLARVLLRVAEPNGPSNALARAAGFTQVGRDRRAEQLRDGRVCDFLRYDLLAQEMDAAWAHPSALR